MPGWGFYGRTDEFGELQRVIGRGRWFFLKMFGRRRIGKTRLIQEALPESTRTFYMQIPDSGPAGVVSAFSDALHTMGIPEDLHQHPASLLEMAQSIGRMAEAGYVVALDEFQYFHRQSISSFTSHLQAVVDDLSARADEVPGGLVVLGSVYTEMKALLDDKTAPLYQRATASCEVDHLDVGTVAEILSVHGNESPWHLLFMWNLFEGVPKYYRDCYEQEVIAGDRREVLRRMYFGSSSPLRAEAPTWFLSEFRGEYDVPLKYVAQHPGCSLADVRQAVTRFGMKDNQVGPYLRALEERFRLIEKKPPVFAPRRTTKHRLYIRDNFLRAWLSALASNVEAQAFRPLDQLIDSAEERLRTGEGFALEQITGLLYQARSRRGVGDFPLTRTVAGYWNSKDTEIDVVAVNDTDRQLRFITCRRDPNKLSKALVELDDHIDRFMAQQRQFESWKLERAAVAPQLRASQRNTLSVPGVILQDIPELLDKQ